MFYFTYRILFQVLHSKIMRNNFFAGVTINGSTCYLYMVYLCGEY